MTEEQALYGAAAPWLPTDTHPLIRGLFESLPVAGAAWPEEKRRLWLDTAAGVFGLIYVDPPLSERPICRVA